MLRQQCFYNVANPWTLGFLSIYTNCFSSDRNLPFHSDHRVNTAMDICQAVCTFRLRLLELCLEPYIDPSVFFFTNRIRNTTADDTKLQQTTDSFEADLLRRVLMTFIINLCFQLQILLSRKSTCVPSKNKHYSVFIAKTNYASRRNINKHAVVHHYCVVHVK